MCQYRQRQRGKEKLLRNLFTNLFIQNPSRIQKRISEKRISDFNNQCFIGLEF